MTRDTVCPDDNEGADEVAVRDEWAVTCRDLAGRRRALSVFVSADRVVLVAPPGEAAVLTSLDVGRLRAVLRDAVMQAGDTDPGEAATEPTTDRFTVLEADSPEATPPADAPDDTPGDDRP
nr:hypothetical protein [Saccharomonospora iraqiensis]